MSDIELNTVEPAGEPCLAYAQTGAGPDVLLLHGTLSALDEMAMALFPQLSEHFRVTAFDRPGHGRSGRLGATGSPWRQARAIHAAAEALELERPVVVGHSFGGAVALAYALQFPDRIAGVVALAPAVFPELRLEHLVFGPRALPGVGLLVNAFASRVADPILLPILWRAMFLPQDMPAKFRAGFPFALAGRADRTEAEGEDAAFMVAGLARSALSYGECRARLRILAGERDMVVNNGLHGRMLARIAPDARYEELPGLGHMLHHFAQGRVVEAVRELAER